MAVGGLARLSHKQHKMKIKEGVYMEEGQILSWPAFFFFFWIIFHFTSSVCLCVGYKMNIGFRGSWENKCS